jgi:CheY-like chemotaxis protein
MRILVVEDDPMIGKTLQQALQQDGYAVDWVTDGRAAQEALATRRRCLRDGAARPRPAAQERHRVAARAAPRGNACVCWWSPRATRWRIASRGSTPAPTIT